MVDVFGENVIEFRIYQKNNLIVDFSSVIQSKLVHNAQMANVSISAPRAVVLKELNRLSKMGMATDAGELRRFLQHTVPANPRTSGMSLFHEGHIERIHAVCGSDWQETVRRLTKVGSAVFVSDRQGDRAVSSIDFNSDVAREMLFIIKHAATIGSVGEPTENLLTLKRIASGICRRMKKAWKIFF